LSPGTALDAVRAARRGLAELAAQLDILDVAAARRNLTLLDEVLGIAVVGLLTAQERYSEALAALHGDSAAESAANEGGPPTLRLVRALELPEVENVYAAMRQVELAAAGASAEAVQTERRAIAALIADLGDAEGFWRDGTTATGACEAILARGRS
jgi:hypothetical protein